MQNSQFGINKALDGTLGKALPPYGKRLTVKIPTNLQQPVAGAYATLTDFKTSVGGTQQRHPVRRPQGLHRGQAPLQGRLQLLGRHEQDGLDHVEVLEVIA